MDYKDGDINEQELVLAECKHMTHPIFIDGDWRSPHQCDACFMEGLSQPISEETWQLVDRVATKLLKVLEAEFSDGQDDVQP